MGDLIRMIRMQQCRAEAAPFAKVCHLSILQQDQGGGLAWFPEPYSTAKHAHIWQVTRTTYTVLFVSMVLTSWMKNHGISVFPKFSKTFWVALKMVKMIQRCNQQLLRRGCVGFLEGAIWICGGGPFDAFSNQVFQGANGDGTVAKLMTVLPLKGE